MSFGDQLDTLIEPFAPRLARRRQAERLALREMRQYDAAANGRRTAGWRRPGTDAGREIRQGLVGTRNAARELVRNNKYAANALRQIVANAIGDGIAPRVEFPADLKFQQFAQDHWDRWAEEPVDGRDDFYGVQKQAFRATVEGGEALLLWGPDRDGPDGRVRAVEGDHLDHLKDDLRAGAGRIVQGVEFDQYGDRSQYHLFDEHPGGGSWRALQSRPFAAANIDHVFETLRPGQTRGVSWFAPFALDLRDLGDYQDARLMRMKVEACLALILSPGEDAAPASPLGTQTAQSDGRPSIERLAPGMIYRTRKGETATSVNPTTSGDGIEFARLLLAGSAGSLAPYHLVSGDVSNASYSSLRAAMLAFWANLDDWQQNLLLPHLCKPAFRRRMRRGYLETGDARFLQVRGIWAPPVRRMLDPIKDIAGEIAEIRAGLKTMAQALAERGRSYPAHLQEIGALNDLIDQLGLALETDPRRVAGSGVLQAAAGYLAPKPDAAAN